MPTFEYLLFTVYTFVNSRRYYVTFTASYDRKKIIRTTFPVRTFTRIEYSDFSNMLFRNAIRIQFRFRIRELEFINYRSKTCLRKFRESKSRGYYCNFDVELLSFGVVTVKKWSILHVRDEFLTNHSLKFFTIIFHSLQLFTITNFLQFFLIKTFLQIFNWIFFTIFHAKFFTIFN